MNQGFVHCRVEPFRRRRFYSKIQKPVAGKPRTDCGMSETGTTEKDVWLNGKLRRTQQSLSTRVFLHPSSPQRLSALLSGFFNQVLHQIMEKLIFDQTLFNKFLCDCRREDKLFVGQEYPSFSPGVSRKLIRSTQEILWYRQKDGWIQQAPGDRKWVGKALMGVLENMES